MYRQEYCGCIFSKVEKEKRDREKAEKEANEGGKSNDQFFRENSKDSIFIVFSNFWVYEL